MTSPPITHAAHLFLILDLTTSPPGVRGVLLCGDSAPTHRFDQRLILLDRASAPTYEEAERRLGRKITEVPAWSGWIVKMLRPEQRRDLGIAVAAEGRRA